VKKQLSAEEAYDRLKEEIEVVSECAEGHVEDAAYWWSRVVGSKAEVVGETLRVNITPFLVQQVISTLLEERLDDCFGDRYNLPNCGRIFARTRLKLIVTVYSWKMTSSLNTSVGIGRGHDSQCGS
jgi:hypothetical protein